MAGNHFMNQRDRTTMNDHAEHIDTSAPSGPGNPIDRINGHAEAFMEGPDEIQNCKRIILAPFTKPAQPGTKTTPNPTPAINPRTRIAWAPLKIVRGEPPRDSIPAALR